MKNVPQGYILSEYEKHYKCLYIIMIYIFIFMSQYRMLLLVTI